ncbi:DUF4397 domain-containing protein [Pseudonocardia hydrocarbonoxydans]|uniref:Peptidase n=1 Tax=Pseudonocardia hydrocarbonoxydans TaxID=76726 RepID=A0A4Y3WNJ2_9PSEU|nr:DUF4397 domain-containing protein [Pseudonocardia hydrocarbonoxydans]GEC20482.1 peptidase [Pseudonocardia hydrocarbonoxydans]
MTGARRVYAVLLTLAALVLSAPPAGAAPGGAAYLRLAHLSPDTPAADVYVASVGDPAQSFVLPGVGYGAVSPYRPVPPGAYVVSMRAAGAAESSPPVVSTTVDAAAGNAYTVAGTGLSAELGLSVLDDRLDMPAAGRASVRVINAAVSAPVVDCGRAGQEPWARDVAFGTSTGYADVPLGTWDLEVTAAGRTVATLPVTLDTNSVYSVLLVDRGGAVAAELHRDSSGTAEVPRGGVETGLGGTAGVGPPHLAGFVAALSVLGVLVAVAVRADSRARR